MEFYSSVCICRRYAAANYKAPQAPLPDFRVQQGYPFSSVSVDYAGPLMIRYAVCTQTSLAHTQMGNRIHSHYAMGRHGYAYSLAASLEQYTWMK